MTEPPRRGQKPARAGLAAAGLTLALLTATGCSADPHPTTPTPTTATAHSSLAANTAHASIGALALTGGYIPQPASPDVAAAYFTVANTSSAPDTMTTVTTNVTSAVMPMQETTSSGVGTMTNLAAVTIPAHGSVQLTPGHAHLMLQTPNRTLHAGDQVTMTITFAHAGTLTLTVPVVPLTGPAITKSGGGS